MAKGKGNKLITVKGEDRIVAWAALPAGAGLVLMSGTRPLTLSPKDWRATKGARASRGAQLPRGYQTCAVGLWPKVLKLQLEIAVKAPRMKHVTLGINRMKRIFLFLATNLAIMLVLQHGRHAVRRQPLADGERPQLRGVARVFGDLRLWRRVHFAALVQVDRQASDGRTRHHQAQQCGGKLAVGDGGAPGTRRPASACPRLRSSTRPSRTPSPPAQSAIALGRRLHRPAAENEPG